MRRPRDVVIRFTVLRFHRSKSCLEHGPAIDQFALRRCPCAEPGAARPTRKIRGRFTFGDFGGRALDANLPLELGPEEKQRGLAAHIEFATLAAFIVGEKYEAALGETLEQHNACRRTALGIGRCERHRVRLEHLGPDRLVEPRLELPERVWRDVTFVERLALVLGAEVGKVQGD